MKILSVFVLVFVLTAVSYADDIDDVAYASLGGSGLITFDAAGETAGTYDGITELGFADFGERFLGQTLTELNWSGDTLGYFDQLGDSDTGPQAVGSLMLVSGKPGQNLAILDFDPNPTTNNILLGMGKLGTATAHGYGEGSFAMLFDYDQSEIGFKLTGGNGGTAYVDFFERDGSRIATRSIALPGNDSTDVIGEFGFKLNDGTKRIAGVSIYNLDLDGIGIDDIIHDVPGIAGHPVPEPSTLFLLMPALLAVAASLRRQKTALIDE